VRTQVELLAIVGERLSSTDLDGSIALWREVRELRAGVAGVEEIAPSFTGSQELGAWSQRLLTIAPVEVLTRVMELAPQDDRTEVVNTMRDWMRIDKVGFAEWLMEREPGPDRDRGAAALSSQLIEHHGGDWRRAPPEPDYESALSWASSISLESTRTLQLQSVVRSWMRTDSEQAGEYCMGFPEGSPVRNTYEALRERGR
jgi:hypothetical protein